MDIQIFNEKVFFIYKAIVLSKVEQKTFEIERKCEYLWDFLIAQAGKLTIETTCPKLWQLLVLSPAPHKNTSDLDHFKI